jgi:hypothetical protein
MDSALKIMVSLPALMTGAVVHFSVHEKNQIKRKMSTKKMF